MYLILMFVVFSQNLLRLICASLCPNFVCVVESWLGSEIDDSEVSIQDYNIARLDRSRHGGGLVIYVHVFIFCYVQREP